MQINNASDFTIRIRFRIPAGHRIGVDRKKVKFTWTSGRELILMSANNNKNISESNWLVLMSSGWESEKAANGAKEPMLDALRRALIRHQMGIDLGGRSLKGGGFTKAFRDRFDQRILNDIHGAIVYKTEPRPIFSRMEGAGGWPPIPEERWKKTFTYALKCEDPLTERERTAFDLFSAARRVRDSADAHFLLLFTSIETLIEENPQPQPVLDHIDRLIDLTRDADLDEPDKKSLLGKLEWMRSKSIRSSGRKLVREKLAGRNYQDRSAEKLFKDCYNLRNRLVHGALPYPTPEEVKKLVNALDTMVCDLLSGPLLDFEIA